MADVPSTEQLLQDIRWLKSLATKLASDRDDADDLVQEAWIAAWRRQPDASRPMRGWLAKVVRDLAGMKHRSDRRRTARNAIADDAQAPAAPDELAQLRLHQLLVKLVIELDEPYRSTIIGHFVEGRTSASIAESLGIPAGTVRKRLHEALSRLRAGLDADAGERKRWAPAVLAFAHGGMQVAKPTKLVLVVLAALLFASVATVSIVLPTRSGPPTSMPASSETTRRSASNEPSVDDARSPRPSKLRARAAMLAAIERAREARGGVASKRPSTGGGPTTAGSDSTATTLDLVDNTGDTSDWQKRALVTLNGLLGQCFDLGRAEDASLEGTVVIRFKLVGEPDIGGLLERVEIVDADSTITQTTIRDCFTEQLYALELDPPPDGLTVERELHLKVP